jgi:plasmid stability protein
MSADDADLVLIDPVDLITRELRDTRNTVKKSTRNITLALEESLIRSVRIIAARQGKSVSALLRDELIKLVTQDEGYMHAMDSALTRYAGKGMDLGGGPYPTREELHDRAGLR